MIRKRRRANGTMGYQVIENGVRTLTFDNSSDAEDYRADARRRRRTGALYQAPPESFGAMLDGYVARRQAIKQHREKTKSDTKEVAKKLDPIRDIAVPALRTAHVEDLVAEVAAVAPRQAKRLLQLSKAILRAAESRGQQVDRGIFQIEPPSYEEREARFLTVEQLYELSSWLPEYIRRIVPVAGLTGLRQGELFDLTDEDLDLDDSKLWVRKGKTKAARRTVSLSSEVTKLLREQLLARPVGSEPSDSRKGVTRRAEHGRAVEMGGASPRPRGRLDSGRACSLLFPTPTGKRWDKNRFMEREYRPATKRAGLEGLRFHDLRHTYASLMLAAGANAPEIAEQMGHSDGGALVHRRYGHLYPEAGKRAMAKLDAMLEEVANAK